MYLTSLFGFLTVIAAVLGFLGLGFGTMPIVQVFFYIFLVATIVLFFVEKRSKRKKYYD